METNAPIQPVNSPEIPVQPQPIQPPVNNQKGFFHIILGVIILLAYGGGAYYLGTQQNKLTTSKLVTYSNPPNTNILQTTPIPTTTSSTQKIYKTRYFDVTDIFWEKDKYPAEITQIEDNSLTPISCTSTYSGFGKDYTSYDEKTQKSIPLTDSSLLNYIQVLGKKYEGKKVSEIYSCSPEQGKSVVVYSLGPCGGGCSGIPYVGVINGSDIIEVANVSEGIAYFGCRQPLQLSKDNMFYFGCRAGDGPGGSATIYKLSLNTLTVSKIIHCIAGIDEAGKSYSKCE